MSDDTRTVQNELWEAMADRAYRDTFVDAHIPTSIAAQIYALREANGWTQTELAQRTDMSQARISLMEDPSYDKFSLSTLKRLRAAFDVALVVRFVPYSELVDWASDVSPSKLAPRSYRDDQPNRPVATIGGALPSAAEAARRGGMPAGQGAQILSFAESYARRGEQRAQASAQLLAAAEA